MGRNRVLMLFLFALASSSSASFIADGVFDDSHGSTGRSLLQAKKSCPLNFEFMNYTVITSKCKGPQYPPKICCAAFKEFACPYTEEINDQTNDCATTMFSYINLYGKYPPGLFASECREGKEGLACPENSTSTSKLQGSTAHWSNRLSHIAVFVAAFMLIMVLF